MKYLVFFVLFLVNFASSQVSDTDIDEDSGLYTIEGKVYPPEIDNNYNWQEETQIVINSGEIKGFLKNDGSFVISKVSSGSFIIQVINPNYYYEAVKVEINNKGKFRARKVNHVQPNAVTQIPYPLKLKALTTFRYFQVREQWKVTDLLFSPMVLMMVLPLILLVLLPKIMSDPETKREMENMQLPKLGGDMPEMSEFISKFLGGGAPKEAASGSSGSGTKTKKKN